jgi:hypothetical protein
VTAVFLLALLLGIEPPPTGASPEVVSDPPASTAPGEQEQPASEPVAEPGDPAPPTETEPEPQPLPSGTENRGEIEVATPEEIEARERDEKRTTTRSGMPDAFASDDYGPFFEDEAVSEVKRPHVPRRPHPPLSVAKGWFCFVDNSKCKVSVIADSDVGAGVNVISSARGLDVPYTQFRTRFGFVLRPIAMKKSRGWHPWGVGLVGSWSIGSASIASQTGNSSETGDDVVEYDPISAWRVGLVNQLWLSKKNNSFHLDFTLGGVNSPVLDAPGRFWGTTAEVSGTWGGWGGVYLNGDFLDRDSRVIAGVRVHDVAAGPIIGLVILGLLAGGAL